MKRSLFIAMLGFGLFNIVFSLFAQDRQGKIDSLEQVIKSNTNEAAVDALYSLIAEYYDVDNDKAFLYAEEELRLANVLGDSFRIVRANRVRAQLLRRVDRSEEAIFLFKKLEPVALKRGYRDEYKKILNGLAISYMYTAQYDDALRYNFKSLSVREEEGNDGEISIALNNIATVYTELGNYGKALQFFYESLDRKNNVGDTFDLDRLLINIGLCLNHTDNPEKGREYIKRGLETCGSFCSDRIKIEALESMGKSYCLESQYRIAKSYYIRALRAAREINNGREELEALVNLIDIDDHLHHYDSAWQHVKEAEVIALRTHSNGYLPEIYQAYCKLLRKENDYRTLSTYQEKFITIKDSVYTRKLTQNLMALQAEYEQVQNRATIELQKKNLELTQTSLNTQIKLNVTFGIGLALLIALIVSLYVNIRQKKRVAARLEELVQERTSELRANFELQQKSFRNHENFVGKSSEDLGRRIRTLISLLSLAKLNVVDLTALEFLTRINNAVEDLATSAQKLQKGSPTDL